MKSFHTQEKSAEQDGTFHGGFVRPQGNSSPAVLLPKKDELAKVNPAEAQDRSDRLKANRRPGSFPNGPSPLKERRTKLACLGIPSAVLEAGSPEYYRTIKLANSYKKARTKELYIAHGYVSSGVAALLAAASLALSASRFLYEIAANTPIRGQDGGLGMPQILKLASGLSDSARQNELSAWELCAREAVIRKRNDNNNQSLPWTINQPDGKESRKIGRPRKVEVFEEPKDRPRKVEILDAGPSQTVNVGET